MVHCRCGHEEGMHTERFCLGQTNLRPVNTVKREIVYCGCSGYEPRGRKAKEKK